MSTVAVIQARSGSKRFPRKVLADLQGRPLLEHVVDRVLRATTVDRVVVATTVDPADAAVAAVAVARGVAVTRGPVEDVLSRYAMAVREHGGDLVVRITADCPLIDPAVIDEVVRALVDSGADYASNVDPPTFPDGYDTEALTASCLWRLDREAVLPHEREHVTALVREHPADFRVVHVSHPRDLSWMRLTVDVPEDLARVAAVLAALPADPPPDLAAVAAHVEADARLSGREGLPDRDERYRAQREAAQRQETS